MSLFNKVISGVFLSSVSLSAVSASATGTEGTTLVGNSGSGVGGVTLAGDGDNGDTSVVSSGLGQEGAGSSGFADDWRSAEQYYMEASGKILELKDTLLATKLQSDLENARQLCSGSADASARVVYRQKAFDVLSKVDRLLTFQKIEEAQLAREKEEERRKNEERTREQKAREAEEMERKKAREAEELERQKAEIDSAIYKLQEKQIESKLNDEQYKTILERIGLLKEKLLNAQTPSQVRECWNNFDDINSRYDALLREQYRQEEGKLLKELESFREVNTGSIDDLEKRIGGFEKKAYVRRNKASELVSKLRTLLENVKNPYDMLSYSEEFIRCRDQFEKLEEEDREARVAEEQSKLKLEDFEALSTDPELVARWVKEGRLSADFAVVGMNGTKKVFRDYLKRVRKYLDPNSKGFRPAVDAGILIYGPGGTGKSWINRIMTAEAKCDFCVVNTGHWIGKGIVAFQEYLDQVISAADRSSNPLIICLDDAEKMLAPETSFAGYVRSVIDKEKSKGRKSRVRFFINTNHKSSIEPSLLRSGRVSIAVMPDALSVSDIKVFFENYASFFKLADNVDFAKVAEWCRGRSPAFIKGVFLCALQVAMEKSGEEDSGNVPVLSQEDFEEGFNRADAEVDTK